MAKVLTCWYAWVSALQKTSSNRDSKSGLLRKSSIIS